MVQLEPTFIALLIRLLLFMLFNIARTLLYQFILYYMVLPDGRLFISILIALLYSIAWYCLVLQ